MEPEEQWPPDEADEPLLMVEPEDVEPEEIEDLILEIQTAPDSAASGAAVKSTFGVEPLPVEIPSASEDSPAPASRGEAERAPDAIATGGLWLYSSSVHCLCYASTDHSR